VPQREIRRTIEDCVASYLSTQSTPVAFDAVEENVVGGYRAAYSREDDWFSAAVSDEARKALGRLERKGKARYKKRVWSWIGPAEEVPPPQLVEPVGDVFPIGVNSQTAASIPARLTEPLTPEETIGSGNEIVYVYFNEAERKLAKHEGRDWWPCKVGYTSGGLSERPLAQSPRTAIGRLPIVGLVIKTEDGRALERTLHFALESAASRMSEAIGDEWFETTPQKIKEWYSGYVHTIGVLRRETLPNIAGS
jgi:hypothetical protein